MAAKARRRIARNGSRDDLKIIVTAVRRWSALVGPNSSSQHGVLFGAVRIVRIGNASSRASPRNGVPGMSACNRKRGIGMAIAGVSVAVGEMCPAKIAHRR